MNWLDDEFNKLINLKNTSTLLSSEDAFNEKVDYIKNIFYALDDNLKKNCISLLKSNTLTHLIKDNVSEMELDLLNRENLNYCNDFISLAIILNCYTVLNFRNFVEENIC